MKAEFRMLVRTVTIEIEEQQGLIQKRADVRIQFIVKLMLNRFVDLSVSRTIILHSITDHFGLFL